MKHPHHKPYPSLHTPWSLDFARDGTEDFGIIRDVDGVEIITSRQFWLPERNDPYPTVLYALRVMTAAPELKDAVTELLQCLMERQEQPDARFTPREQSALQLGLKALLKAGEQ